MGHGQFVMHDGEVIDLLGGNGPHSLLDSYLLDVSMRDDPSGSQTITLRFRARPSSKHSEVTLHFTDLVEFGFRSDDGLLGDVGSIKFLKLPDGSFYISLDPAPSTTQEAGASGQPSDSDNFVVRSKHISAAVTVRNE